MFSLISLPYALDALEPVISRQTLEFHYGKHLKAYVDNLNKLTAGTDFEGKSLVEIVKSSTGAVFNNAGQILNHELYFTQFRSFVAGAPQDDKGHSEHREGSPLFKQILKQWGSVEAFQADFEAKGTALFGSGWVWLAAKADGALEILQCPGADNPVTRGLKPLLTFDVWEHAYYLDYQNRRAAHLKELWEIVDWSVVEGRY